MYGSNQKKTQEGSKRGKDPQADRRPSLRMGERGSRDRRRQAGPGGSGRRCVGALINRRAPFLRSEGKTPKPIEDLPSEWAKEDREIEGGKPDLAEVEEDASEL